MTDAKKAIARHSDCLVDLETLKLPICLIKLLRVIGHEVRAGAGAAIQLLIELRLGSQLAA
jgi:hypothetical protein